MTTLATPDSRTGRVLIARARKAMSIARILKVEGVNSETAAYMDQAGRDAAAKLAAVRSPSKDTWQLVVAALEHQGIAEAIEDVASGRW